jgi:hypothetical protein
MFALASTQTAFGDAPGWALALQGFYDIIPTVFFMLGAIILLRELYGKMVKGNYALLAAGSIMVFSAGIIKAFHKVLMGLARVDYVIMDKQFAPTQSIGFLLLFIAMIGMFTSYNIHHLPGKKQEPTKMGFLALPVLGLFLAEGVGEYGLKTFDSTIPFIVIMVLGALGFLVMLIVVSAKMKKIPEIVFFSISILMMFGMGYLSTKHYFEGAWIQISVNIVYQACFFGGCLMLKKHDVANFDLFTKKEK